jgi:hypothetical protein
MLLISSCSNFAGAISSAAIDGRKQGFENACDGNPAFAAEI